MRSSHATANDSEKDLPDAELSPISFFVVKVSILDSMALLNNEY